MSLEVFGSSKDIIAEFAAQVLGASDVGGTTAVGTESTWNAYERLRGSGQGAQQLIWTLS